MNFTYKFQKILSIKETEKERAFEVYQTAVKEFEEVAEKLYECLKKKENLETNQHDRIITGLSVNELRHHQNFIVNLEKTIMHFQKLVMEKRQKMQTDEEVLMRKNIEVKKYEQIKEKQYTAFVEILHANESKVMDEISIQQFMNRGS